MGDAILGVPSWIGSLIWSTLVFGGTAWALFVKLDKRQALTEQTLRGMFEDMHNNGFAHKGHVEKVEKDIAALTGQVAALATQVTVVHTICSDCRARMAGQK